MVKIVWTNVSVAELKDIFDYISIDSKRYVLLQVKKIKAKTEILKSIPEIGRIVPEFENKMIRELIEGNYRIVYRIKSEFCIEILTVHHSSRNFSQREILPS